MNESINQYFKFSAYAKKIEMGYVYILFKGFEIASEPV